MTTVKMKFLLGYTMKILYSGQEGTFSGENFFFFFFEGGGGGGVYWARLFLVGEGSVRSFISG